MNSSIMANCCKGPSWEQTRALRLVKKKMRLCAGRQWAKNPAESVGFLTLWPTKKRTDSPPKARRYCAATAPLSYRFGGHRDVVLGIARFGPDQDAQGLSRRKGKNRQRC